jgi:hypothetical protein
MFKLLLDVRVDIVPVPMDLVITPEDFKKLKKRLGVDKIPDMWEQISAKCSLAAEKGVEISHIELHVKWPPELR